MFPVGYSSLRTFFYAVILLLAFSWQEASAQTLVPQAFNSTVSTIATGQTDRFTDATLIGRHPGEFMDKWILFISPTWPDGIVSRIRTFNPAKGEIRLYDSLPGGLVRAGDAYRVGATPWKVGALGTSRFLMASSTPGCVPTGTPTVNIIICTAGDTRGVDAQDNNDAIVIIGGASVVVTDSTISPALISESVSAIGAGPGDDSVLNTGVVQARTDALLTPLLTPPSPLPSMSRVWDALISIDTASTAIDGGTGDDELANLGTLTSTSLATIVTALVPGTVPGVSSADVSSTATASATGMEGGDGSDALINRGTISADATATTIGIGVAFQSVDGKGGEDKNKKRSGSTVTGDVKANASASALSSGAGDDKVDNSAALNATASATSLAGGVGIGVKGDAAVSAKSSADATAMGVSLGDGSDVLLTTGALTAQAEALAGALNVSVALPGQAGGSNSDKPNTVKSAVNGGATATSSSTGIAADGADAETTRDVDLSTSGGNLTITYQQTDLRPSGNDTVTNAASVAARASSTSGTLGVAVTIDGEASAAMTSSATAQATGLDLGGGHDQLTNAGALTSSASSTALALDVSVGVKTGDKKKEEATSAVEGSAEAQSKAIGIAADSTAQDVSRTGSVTVGGSGFGITLAEIKKYASGDDTVVNVAAIDATANATTLAAGLGVSVGSGASAKITSSAQAGAVAIDLGGGHDTVSNFGTLTANADADAAALNIAVGVDSSSSSSSDSDAKSAADGGATAKAEAFGLASDSTAGDSARSLTLSIGAQGLTLSYRQSEARASGDDVVRNFADIAAGATSTASAAGIGITVKGAASASSKSTSEATAAAIDLGGGADALENTGTLTASADSTAQALKVAVSTKGGGTASDGFWQGGTTSTASAVGIDAAGQSEQSTEADVSIGSAGVTARYETHKNGVAGDGADHITNLGAVNVDATARSTTANVGISADGTAAAVSHVEVETDAAGVRAGEGHDTIENLGEGRTSVTSDAQAQAVSIAVSGKGVAIAADALWDTGVKAEATATGIDADGGDDKSLLITASITGSGVQIVYQKAENAASGNDVVVNEQAIDTTAAANATSVGVALEAKKGLAAVVSSAESEAESAAIRAGDGDDVITNSGDLTSRSSADTQAISVALAKEGLALATNSVWDGGTKAEAVAVGIDSDGGNRSTVKNTTLAVDGSGASIVHSHTEEAARGNDTIENSGTVDVLASSTTVQAAIAATMKGVSAAFSQATATSEATAIRGGDGDDNISNTGLLISRATALPVAVNVAVTLGTGGALAANGVWDGGVTATATATGIDGDGGNRTSSTSTTITTAGGGDIERVVADTAASGDDVIVNSGIIAATARATTPDVAVAFDVKGVAAAISTATANAQATAISAGEGNDRLTNTGQLTADAAATAVAVNVGIASKGIAVAANDVWDGGVNADALAKGIDGAGGVDLIVNDADITARSNATSPSVAVAVAVTGLPIAVSTSTATSAATAIDGGSEADTILTLGLPGRTLTADADALAVTANVAVANQGLAIAADAVWDGGTRADATAKGIDAGSGADTTENAAAIAATADAISAAAGVSVAVTGVAGATATSTAVTSATAIDAGEGQDSVGNAGTLSAKANSIAGALTVTVTNTGIAASTDAVWNGGTTASAAAKGIAAGSGNDLVSNQGLITAEADTIAGSASVGVAVTGVAAALANSTATSDAVAIDAGDGADQILNSRKLIANSDALAFALPVSVAVTGVAVGGTAVWDGGTTSGASARGIAAADGSDLVANVADIDADASAITGTASVSVAVTGVAAAIATSTANAASSAIDTGAGADEIANDGKLTANSDATAATVTVGVTTAGVSAAGDAAWNGGTTANAAAKGITAGDGADAIVNTGDIRAETDATTVAAGVSVAVTGVAGGIATSTANASSIAIDGGDGADSVRNLNAGVAGRTGNLVAEADAIAAAATVTVTTAGVAVSADAVWDGGTKAEATAKGIDAGAGGDDIANESAIAVDATATTVSAGVAVAVTGVAGAVTSATGKATAAAIDTGIDEAEGADRVVNSGSLTANATSTAVAAGIGFTLAGLSLAGDAAWDGGTTAQTLVRGIVTGQGTDTIFNAGRINATADSTTVGVSASIAVFGAAAGVATATADANASAVDGGAGDDLIDNLASGILTSNAEADAVAVNVSVAGIGAGASADSVWDTGTTARTTASGLDGGAGQDTITNAASISATADSSTTSVGVGLTGIGLSAAVSTSTATARSAAIGGGDDSDAIENTGVLTSHAIAAASGISVSLTGVGVAAAADKVWDGGTTADAAATGIGGGAGGDLITNGAAIAARADSTTTSVAVTIAGIGGGGAVSTSTSTATAVAIDGGDDDDNIENRALLTATSIADATGVAVTVTGLGASGSLDAVWEGGTKANANATAIGGGAANDRILVTTSPVSTSATSTTHSTAVAISGVGLGAAVVGSTSTARATGLDGGAGSDEIALATNLTSTATAHGTGVSVGVTLAGAATAGSLLDNQTRAESVATGIAGGTGNDWITTFEEVLLTLVSSADTTATAVSVSLAGLASADANTRAIANATGVAGGAGNDVLENRGDIGQQAAAESKARSVSVTIAGAASGGASSAAEASAVGLDGGEENDSVSNTGSITLTSTGTARAQNVSVSVFGTALNDATGTGRATAVGLVGGGGHDLISNAGSITLSSTGVAFSQHVGVSVAGASVNDSSAISEGSVIGMDGGAGRDSIANSGTISGTAAATTTTNSTGVVVAGSTMDKSNSVAAASATGIAGGGEADIVANAASGTITVGASATTSANGTTVSVFGSSGGEARTTAVSDAFGITAGTGEDVVVNNSTITVSATSSSSSTNASINIFGAAGGTAETQAQSTATGVDGGDDSDDITNASGSLIDVTATATSFVTGGGISIFGSAGGNAKAKPFAGAAGLVGGAGHDTIVNDGTVSVRAFSTSTTNNSNTNIFGSAGGIAGTSAEVSIVGLSGGSGSDTLINRFTFKVNAVATATIGASSWNFAGGASQGTSIDATSRAFGFDGGNDADHLRNEGDLEISLASTLTATGGSTAIFGNASNDAQVKALSQGFGLSGGIGTDTIENADRLSVSTTATLNATKTSVSFAGAPTSSAMLEGRSEATGIDGGGEADTIRNENGGEVEVTARGVATSTGGARSQAAGNAATSGVAASAAAATGLEGGAGEDRITNAGVVNVSAIGEAKSTNESSAGLLFSSGTSQSDAAGTATATGISGGDDGNELINQAALAVTSDATGFAASASSGAVLSAFGLGGNATSVSAATAYSTATGMFAGDDENTILNSGNMTVNALASTVRDLEFTICYPPPDGCVTLPLGTQPTTAGANGNGASGDGWASASVVAQAAAFGIRVGNGDNTITNSGEIHVTANPVARTLAQSDGDLEGNATSYATATGQATAVGIEAGHGNNIIHNTGSLFAIAKPDVQATATASGGDWCIWFFGLHCGLGGNGRAWATATVGGNATGILAGDGHNQIINDGFISARADAYTGQTPAVANGSDSASPTTFLTLEAVGIKTGTGNDLIVNRGTIESVIVQPTGASSAGIAIDSGRGDDTVVLGAGSRTTGNVQLGEGNDTLEWQSTAILDGVAFASAGTDVFALGGSVNGNFQMSLLGSTFRDFETYHKRGTSTWALWGDRRINWTVDEGTLVVDNGTDVTGTIDTGVGGQNAGILVRPTGSIRRDDLSAPAVVLNGGTLTNEGTVSAIGTAVRLNGSGGSVVNETGGVITGLLAIQGGDGNDFVANHGRLVGGGAITLDLGAGEDELLISSTSQITGIARGGAGDDTFALGGDTDARFNLAHLDSVYQEFERFDKRGSATWTLFGEGTFDWTVGQGSLNLEGTLFGSIGTSAGGINPIINIGSTGVVRRTDSLSAVALNGGATLINTGIIDMSGAGVGVQAFGSGNLIDNRGRIQSGGLGIALTGNASVVSNAGVIEAIGTGVLVSGAGTSVTNTGSIYGTVGIDLTGSHNTIVNSGTIAAHDGVRLRGSSSSLFNAGEIFGLGSGVTVEADHSIVSNTGSVVGSEIGILVTGHDTSLVNEGTIRSTSEAGNGVLLSGDVSLTNFSEISASGAAVKMQTAGGTVVNAFGGLIQSSGGPGVEGSEGTDRVENYGTIEGGNGSSVALGGGDDDLLAHTASVFGGTATGGAGFDTLRLTGDGGAITDLSTFIDFEMVNKEGSGIWLLNGIAQSAWNISEGQLIVQGVLGGVGSVHAGTRLLGSGSVGGFVNEGTVAPGAWIGTLRVAGDFSQGAGGVLEIENTGFGLSDRLNVSGQATLNGTLAAVPDNELYGVATEYTILNAAGGVSGAFNSATSTLSYLDPVVDYFPTSVVLTLIRNDISFASMSDASSLQSFGAALDANKKAMAKGDFKVLMDQFVVMESGDHASALFSLSGELHATAPRALMRTGDRFFSNAANRQLSARMEASEGKTFWTDVVNFSGRLGADGNGSAADYRASGLSVGADVMVGDDTQLGMALGFSPARIELAASGGGSASAYGYHPSLHGKHRIGRWQFGASVGYSRYEVDAARDVQVGPITRRAAATYHADQYSGMLRSAYALVLSDETRSSRLEAVGELWYSKLARNGFVESGAGSANLTDAGYMETNSLQSLLGVRATWSPKVWGIPTTSDIQLGWAHESLDDRGDLTASLAGASRAGGFLPFAIRGARSAEDSFRLTIGTSGDFSKHGRAFIAYDGWLADVAAEHGFAAGLRFGW